ncbi:DNA polymerase III subunit beta [Paenibacillus sp. Marseille-Q4541]|uniref:DNA polymerase III subunit beta n=1 Tax=Paenibacillus sp. Marseille-Q4541 TaxID=2831522 RepID=UPI001BA9C43D
MKSVLLEIGRDELYQALQHVLKAVSHHAMPILSGIHIDATNKGLIFTASDLSLSIKYTVFAGGGERMCSIQQTGSMIVPATYFYEIIRKLDSGKIVLQVIEKATLFISANKAHFRLSGVKSSEQFPLLQHTESSQKIRFSISNKALIMAIRQMLTATSDAVTRPLLTGVLFEYRDNFLAFTATDSIILSTATANVYMETKQNVNKRVVVPRKSLNELLKVVRATEDVTEIEINSNNIKFITTQIQLHSVLLQGEYPFIQNLIPKTLESEVILRTSNLLQSTQRASVLASENTIHISVMDKKVGLHSKISEVGDMKDELSVLEKTGGDFQVSLNSKFLTEILRNFGTENTKLQYSGHLKPIIFRPVDSLINTLYLLPPIRTSTI